MSNYVSGLAKKYGIDQNDGLISKINSVLNTKTDGSFFQGLKNFVNDISLFGWQPFDSWVTSTDELFTSKINSITNSLDSMSANVGVDYNKAYAEYKPKLVTYAKNILNAGPIIEEAEHSDLSDGTDHVGQNISTQYKYNVDLVPGPITVQLETITNGKAVLTNLSVAKANKVLNSNKQHSILTGEGSINTEYTDYLQEYRKGRFLGAVKAKLDGITSTDFKDVSGSMFNAPVYKIKL